MKRLFTLSLFVLLTMAAAAQQPVYSRLKINMEGRELRELAELGVDTESMEYRPGLYVIGEYSEKEQDRIAGAGFSFEVLIEDMSAYYSARNAGLDKAAIEASWRKPDPNRKYQTPENFSLGSMGGYLTYDELLAELDAMHAQYPDLISEKAPIGTILTIQWRPVYWLRISNNPDVEQDKPKVLYTALMHAREPIGMQQMIYQMWYLLENYGTDPEITYLMDNVEMYFVPCINPDGYIYNQQTNPNGGGMYRKNMRLNGDGSYGVDLNRNFGYFWGHDDSGSSSTPSSMTYRGTAPFSEPETQIVKYFAEQFDFDLALNNHTYSDLLIYPWGYQNQLTPDGEIFSSFAELLTRENNYTYGTCYETLNYLVNGGSDDWFYGEQETKDKVFAFTPEAGSPSDGFWPAMNRIEEICAGHTWMNLGLANLALSYAELKPLAAQQAETHYFYFPFEIKNLGLASPSSFTVSVEPISPLVISSGGPLVFEEMEVLETLVDSIQITLHPSTYAGLMYDFEVLLDNGSFIWRDTIRGYFGEAPVLFADNFETSENWSSTVWGLTSNQYVSAPNSMTDSPGGQYGNYANAVLTLNDPVDLSNHGMAFTEFSARWDIESNYDYVQLQVSENGGTSWTALPGLYTRSGSNNQDSGQHLWDGNQSTWVQEKISLEAFAGKEILMRFRLVSDVSLTKDGFYFDDFKIYALEDFEPLAPVITGQQPMTILMGETFSIELEWITVEDNFVSYPQGHTLEIIPGEDYSLEGDNIVPDPDFYGNLEVLLKVNNGILESEEYPFVVEVLNTMDTEELLQSNSLVFYNQLRKSLVLVPGNDFENGALQLTVFDLYGRKVHQEVISNAGGRQAIPLALRPGVYVFEIRGEQAFRGKFCVY
ncbi:MAG: M14 family zinc carboxypeptidase [Bacteroides sp.]|jgi:hypothetical protein|nr:M14 family zinc carboxypeptidase [Bacteroides sp.]